MGHANLSRRPEAILIAGPTASGKSALATRLATRLGGVVINADSMQVYADLRIVSARPDDEATRAVPHALYGTIDGATNYSVSLWLADAAAAIAATQADGLLPIVVGGTGLYFKALTQGLSDIPPVPDDVRAAIRAWADGQPAAALHVELSRRDPATAVRLLPSDPQRILRAIEVHEATGESLSTLQGRRAPPVLDLARTQAVALHVERDVLRGRIDRRFDAMVDDGALDEVAALAARKLDPALPVMRAIGVPPLLRYLEDGLALNEAIAESKLASRQYVKRQETFARHQLKGFRLIHVDQAEAMLLAEDQS